MVYCCSLMFEHSLSSVLYFILKFLIIFLFPTKKNIIFLTIRYGPSGARPRFHNIVASIQSNCYGAYFCSRTGKTVKISFCFIPFELVEDDLVSVTGVVLLIFWSYPAT